MTKSIIRGVGGYLPQRIVSNQELSAYIDTSDEWIKERSGIGARHIADPLETTSVLAANAARIVLEDAGLSAQDIDLIIVATTTPDDTFPSTAVRVQALLDVPVCVAFDVAAVCTGFVYAFSVADSMLKNGLAKRALVIGAETMSRILNWRDRGTCVLFADGAGAVILEAVADDAAGNSGVLGHALRADGRQIDILHINGGPSRGSRVGKMVMLGQAVFRQAVNNISEAIVAACAVANVAISDIDWFVPHQANKRILDGVAKKLSIDEDKVVVTLDKHGNTSAGSVPLALWEARKDGRIKDGDLVLLEAMGGGLTWGANLFRW